MPSKGRWCVMRSMMSKAKTIIEVSSSLLMAAAAVLLMATMYETRGAGSPAEPASAPVSATRIEASRLGYVRGQGQSAIVEFSDFECPFCAKYAKETFPTVVTELIDKGVVRYSVVHFPLERIHPLAVGAGKVAECAGRQGQYWPMYAQLFGMSPQLSETNIAAAVVKLDLDASALDNCVMNDAATKIDADIAEGRRLGVSGTPVFFIGNVREDGSIDVKRRVTGFVSYNNIKAELERLKPVPSWRSALSFGW